MNTQPSHLVYDVNDPTINYTTMRRDLYKAAQKAIRRDGRMKVHHVKGQSKSLITLKHRRGDWLGDNGVCAMLKANGIEYPYGGIVKYDPRDDSIRALISRLHDMAKGADDGYDCAVNLVEVDDDGDEVNRFYETAGHDNAGNDANLYIRRLT